MRRLVSGFFVASLALLAVPFVVHAVRSGAAGLFAPGVVDSRFFVPGQAFSNIAIFSHMALGAALMVFMPLQFVARLRSRWPWLHRGSGRVLCLTALLTGAGGLIYIGAQGTIGGPPMSLGFALYGVLLILCAAQTYRHGRKRQSTIHRRWALRLIVLAFASWFYRVHYGIWYLLTGGLASTPQFDGAFDLVQNFAFYLPYLVVLELWLRRGEEAG